MRMTEWWTVTEWKLPNCWWCHEQPSLNAPACHNSHRNLFTDIGKMADSWDRKAQTNRIQCVTFNRHLYLYLYLRGGQPKLRSAEAVYIWSNVQPQCDQRSGKPLSGSREPKKSGWSHFAWFLRLHGMCSHDGVHSYHIGRHFFKRW